MKNLEFFKNISIGTYIEGDSPVHKMSPAAKFAWLLAILVPASAVRSTPVLGVLAASCFLFALLAKIKPSALLRGFLPVLPLLGFVALLQIIFSWPQDHTLIIIAVGPVSLTMREVLAVASMALRFVVMMLALGLFTSVITEGDTARGLEDFFGPLSRIGFPAHDFALTVAIAFRFIPIIAGELEAIVKAQAARGADFGVSRGGPIRKARAYLPLFVPVTIRALERAENLAEAMEARCYVSKGRTRYAVTAIGRWDPLVKTGAVLYAAAALTVSVVFK